MPDKVYDRLGTYHTRQEPVGSLLPSALHCPQLGDCVYRDHIEKPFRGFFFRELKLHDGLKCGNRRRLFGRGERQERAEQGCKEDHGSNPKGLRLRAKPNPISEKKNLPQVPCKLP